MIARVVRVLWAGSVGGSGRLARGAVELVGDVGGAAVRLAGRGRWARPAVVAWRRVCRAWAAERAAVHRRRAGAALVAVALIASSLGLSTAGVGGQESEGPPASEVPPGDGGGGSGVWWDGSASLAASAPLVSASGRCESFGGWLGLFAGGSLSSVCPTGVVSDGVSLVGSPRGVGWFEGFDADGPYAGVELFGGSDVAAGVFGALGEMDVIFEGGTFSIDFSGCEHRAEAGYSSCRVAATGVPLPPGALVGVATPGTEAPPRGIAGAGASAATPAAERAALVALYNATDGANWLRKTNWNTTVPVRSWYGVLTNSDGSVTNLYLSGNNLSGRIPAALGALTNLETLTLSRSGLSGGIPPALGALTNLELLQISRSGLSGGIPPALGNLTNLTNLSLSDNDLSGEIPATLGNLGNLRGLWLNFNDLSGSIPPELGGLTNLGGLGLSSNDLSGSVPPELGGLTNLAHLNLQLNDLSGAIPATFGRLTNLQDLDLLGNKMSGPISVLGGLTSLQRLNLSGNADIYTDLNGGRGFWGPIPAGLGNATGLTFVNLSWNTLSGPIPSTFGNLTKLRQLYLDNNAAYVDGEYISGLTGPVPASLGNLVQLRTLNLSGNLLSGCIPAALSAIPNFRSITGFDRDLSFCRNPVLHTAVLVGGSAVHLIFDLDLDEFSVPPVGAFTVSVAGADRAISAVTVTGRQVRLVLASPVPPAGDVTVSYTVPEAADSAGLRNTVGDAAEGFADESVIRAPDPPTITDITSSDGALAVSWDRVFGMTSHFLEWREHGTETWQSTRQRFAQQFTIDDLISGAVYWIRIRAVRSTGAGRDQTLYATGWSTPQPAIVGDWAPQNLKVTPGDRMLTVTWDDVPVATGYEVEYRPVGEVEWVTYRRGRFSPSIQPPVMLWGLDNDTSYRVRVRAVASVGSSPGTSLRSAWAVSRPESPTVEFAVADVSGVRLVRGGGYRVYRTVHLVHADDPRRDFAGRPMGVMIHAGPSKGRPVDCVSGAVVPVGLVEGGPLFDSCETDGEGMLRLSYVPSVVVGNDEVGKDFFSLYADLDEDGVHDAGESPLVAIPGNVQVARRINLVALGDSYSAGQQGNPGDITDALGDMTDAGTRLDDKCSRWDVAYPSVLVRYRDYAVDVNDDEKQGDMSNDGLLKSFACSGAITLNIHDPSGNSETNRPAPSLVVGDEPRQAVGLATVRGRLYGESPSRSVDMVTLTIGGNDLGFAAVFKACYLLGCGLDEVVADTRKLKSDLPKVLAEVKRKTSHRRHPNRAIRELIAEPPSAHAAIFLLGYPNLVPPLSRDLDDCVELGIQQLVSDPDSGAVDLADVIDGIAKSIDSLRFFVYLKGGAPATTALTLVQFLADFGDDDSTVDLVVDIATVAGASILFGVALGPAVGVATGLILAKDFAEAKARISGDEHRFLLATAQALNGVLRDAAWDAGVHFVSVAEEFDGHYVCGHRDDPGAPWVHGLVGTGKGEVSGATLHPNRAGHRATASILHDFVAQVTERALDRGAVLNRAGVPVAPVVSRPPRSGVVGAAEGSRAAGAAGQGPAGGRAVEAPPPVSDRVLLARAVVPSVCGWLAPGDVVELVASGFAAGSVVGFAVAGASVLDPAASPPLRVVEGLSIPAATADAEGRVSVRWTVPQAPPAATDPLPRWYVIKATGTGAGGEASVLYVARPLVAYPGAAPCAADDAASTTLGRAVRVAVLANDTAPAGGSLDPSSVWVQKAAGGVFSVDGASGAVTFTPDAGFAGTAATGYWVYDGWGLGVRGALSVTVDAGCTITAAGGAVEVVGTEGDDVICVAAPEDPTALHVIDARGGDDVILAGAGVDRIDAGEGDDVVYGRGGDDVIAGGPGFDAIHGGDGFDTVYSTDLVDRIVDDAGGYELILAAPAPAARGAPTPGDDAAHVSVGGAVLVDVLGNDYDSGGNLLAASLRITRAPARGAAAVVGDSVGEIGVLYTAGDAAGVDTFTYEVCDTLNACATAEVTVTVGTARCTIVGTEGDDILRGTPGDDVICGLGGHDVLSGLGGNDVLIGGAGNDGLYGGDPAGDGADDGENVLFGGAGDDTLVGGGGGDVLWGGAGVDSMWGGAGVDTLIGGLGGDTLNGDEGDDVLWGGAGDDVLWGFFGNDVLHGGPGDDELTGNGGDDVLWGGPGDDVLSGHGGDDVLWGGAGDDTLWGNSQDDVLWGGVGDDRLTGGDGDDELHGGAGDDTLVGDAGGNYLPGVDRLWGGSGDDSLDGGAGDDYLDGGLGADACGGGEVVARCES